MSRCSYSTQQNRLQIKPARRDRDRLFTFSTGKVHQKGTTILNIDAPHTGASDFIKKKSTNFMSSKTSHWLQSKDSGWLQYPAVTKRNFGVKWPWIKWTLQISTEHFIQTSKKTLNFLQNWPHIRIPRRSPQIYQNSTITLDSDQKGMKLGAKTMRKSAHTHGSQTTPYWVKAGSTVKPRRRLKVSWNEIKMKTEHCKTFETQWK